MIDKMGHKVHYSMMRQLVSQNYQIIMAMHKIHSVQNLLPVQLYYRYIPPSQIRIQLQYQMMDIRLHDLKMCVFIHDKHKKLNDKYFYEQQIAFYTTLIPKIHML